jgi:hypothetical protein
MRAKVIDKLSILDRGYSEEQGRKGLEEGIKT